MKFPMWVFAIVRSGPAAIVVMSLAASFDVLVSPPPDTATLLVTLEAALFATLAVKVIGGYIPLGAKTSVRLHVWTFEIRGSGVRISCVAGSARLPVLDGDTGCLNCGCPTPGHVQPLPDMDTNVRPVGTVSLTSTWLPSVGPGPKLFTVIV